MFDPDNPLANAMTASFVLVSPSTCSYSTPEPALITKYKSQALDHQLITRLFSTERTFAPTNIHESQITEWIASLLVWTLLPQCLLEVHFGSANFLRGHAFNAYLLRKLHFISNIAPFSQLSKLLIIIYKGWFWRSRLTKSDEGRNTSLKIIHQHSQINDTCQVVFCNNHDQTYIYWLREKPILYNLLTCANWLETKWRITNLQCICNGISRTTNEFQN